VRKIILFVLVFSFSQAGAQYASLSVASKKKSDGKWEENPTRILSSLKGFSPAREIVILDSYGGLKNKQYRVTGFFRTEKINDRWWIITPDGHPCINMSVNSVTPGSSDKQKDSLKKMFGTREKWAAETRTYLQSLGFNGLGSWSDYKTFSSAEQQKTKPLSYTIIWNFMSSYGKVRGGTYQKPGHTGYPNDAIFVFNPEFESFCDSHAKQLSAYKDDKNLLGHFSDNELPFYEKTLDKFLSLPDSNDPGRKAAEVWLAKQNVEKKNITKEIRSRFLAFVGARYFSVVSRAIKKYDPNHLYLGSRLHSTEKHDEHFMKEAGLYLDIIAINYYSRWTPVKDEMSDWVSWTGKPFLITEWYVKAEDSGLPNTTGAGWIVKTQKDRGFFYQNYTLALLESKGCVGWHWFKYQDNDPEQKNAEPSNIDSNKGMVDSTYASYDDLISAMKDLNFQIYPIVEYFDKKNP
jgi:hypothetical protein